jgi:hypothetical protein
MDVEQEDLSLLMGTDKRKIRTNAKDFCGGSVGVREQMSRFSRR